MVVHDLLLNLKKRNVSYSQGFADDLGLMNAGKYPKVICDHMNQSLSLLTHGVRKLVCQLMQKRQANYFTKKIV